jgi:hypothetical protein
VFFGIARVAMFPSPSKSFGLFPSPINPRTGHQEPRKYYNNNKGVHLVTPSPNKAVATAMAREQ